MTVKGLDHINIQTRSLATTVRFFVDVLGLRAGDPPPGLDPARIQWMFDASGRPLFHLSMPGATGTAESEIGRDTGAVHHVALDCQGYEALTTRLDGLGVSYRRLDVVSGLRQLFLREPNGVLLELNFREP